MNLVFLKKDSNAPKSYDDGVMYTHYLPGSIQGCNYDINPITNEELNLLRQVIKDISPDIIGLSTRTFYLEIKEPILNLLRKDNPNAVLLAGGYGPSILPSDFIEYVDYIVFGEGEDTLVEIASYFDAGNANQIKQLQNVGYKDKNGQFAVNSLRKPIKDLDALPFPDWSDKNSYYIESNELKRKDEIRNINWYDIFGSRGCPAHCSYCMASQWGDLYKKYSNSNYPRVRIRTPENVISELEYQKNTQDISYIRFMDSIFTSSYKWLHKFLTLYRQQIHVPFFCNIEVRYQSTNIIKLLCESGMKKTSLGIQSGSYYTRKYIYNRDVSNDQIINISNILKKYNVSIQQDILGFNPFESEDDLLETFNLICELPPNPIVVFKLHMFPNSQIHNLYLKESPKSLPYEYHLCWIYLWHLASFGGRFRKYARDLIQDNNGKAPISKLTELEHMWLDLPHYQISQ
jgi:radical SAM superfamily enzyme YgiQ (UPF0313 family)